MGMSVSRLVQRHRTHSSEQHKGAKDIHCNGGRVLPTRGRRVDAGLEDTAIDIEVFLFSHGEEGPKRFTQTSFPRRKRRLFFIELCPRAWPILHIQLVSMTQGGHRMAISQKSRPIYTVNLPKAFHSVRIINGCGFCFVCGFFLNKE